MTRSALLALPCAGLAALAAGCGSGDGASPARADERAAPAPAQSSGAGATVRAMRSRYGRVLFDGRGRALYLFTRERGRPTSRCYGDCAAAWPPFYTRGTPRAGRGVRRSLLGTTRRRDGRLQVTYNGHPLYYYVADVRAGQITCQDVVEFGGTWLVVDPRGRAVT
jgi:predicted lipoprotein with Yx(FWY)xxD motif